MSYDDIEDARLYDLQNGWGPGDEFYLGLVHRAGDVLDVGCGTGTLLKRARRDGHRGRLVGLDPGAGMLAVAREEPSVEWGWHGGFPKGTQIAGWFSVFACLVMLIGNHQGILSGGDQFKVEDIYLILVAVVLAIGLLIDLRRLRTPWRR